VFRGWRLGQTAGEAREIDLAAAERWGVCVVVNGYRSATQRFGRSFCTCPPPSRTAMASRVSV